MTSRNRKSPEDRGIVWISCTRPITILDDEEYHQTKYYYGNGNCKIGEQPEEVIKLDLHVGDCHSRVAIADRFSSFLKGYALAIT